MKNIRLLDFFRTGKLDEVEIGMAQEDVFDILGEPDGWINDDREISKKPFQASKAVIWGYGPIELAWMAPKTGLHMISFQVDSVDWQSTELKVNQWIFRGRKRSTQTATYLKEALAKEEIPFQDTGLEIILFGEEKYKYTLEPFIKENFKEHDPDDVFGTLVLKSGVQVRYGEDDYIIKVSMPGAWIFKGSEQNVKWQLGS